jgi:phosphoribosylglycinamide formyltransferase-1
LELGDSGRRLGVLISGRGSNLQSIIDAIASGRLDAAIAIVISNRADAAGLQRARDAGIPTLCLSHKDYATREEYDRALVSALRAHRVDLVCLAGFMRIFSTEMLAAYPQRILNIHPSLLPSFPGLHPHRQAIEYGVKYSGATVHLVDGALDGGPIVVQAVVAVTDGDTEDTLAARILTEEHRIYPEAIRLVLDRGWSIHGRRFVQRIT